MTTFGGWHRLYDPDRIVCYDLSLRGWPWVEGTSSWVEATVLALLALTVEKDNWGRGAIHDEKKLKMNSIKWERFGKGWHALYEVGCLQMVIVVIVLTLATHLAIGDMALRPFSPGRWRGIGVVVVLFLLLSLLLDILSSVVQLHRFRLPQSQRIDLRTMCREMFTNPVKGILLVILLGFGVTEAQGLSEYYRLHATTWHDDTLWEIESWIFVRASGSFLQWPVFWDRVYFSLWSYLILAFSLLYRKKSYVDLTVYGIAFVFAYFFTRLVAIQYPTAGPIFYKPELFAVANTATDSTRLLIQAYMEGKISQNGLIPGTMGMPSLHIGQTVMATYFLAKHVRWSLWPGLLWSLLTWLSTLFLGWHYVLDGVGGILVALVSVLLATGATKMMRFGGSQT